MRGSVIDSLLMLLGKQNIRDLHRLSTFEKRTVERFLRSLRVEFIYRRPRITKSISEIEWTSASDYLFDTDDGQTNVAVSGISRNLELQSLILFSGILLAATLSTFAIPGPTLAGTVWEACCCPSRATRHRSRTILSRPRTRRRQAKDDSNIWRC